MDAGKVAAYIDIHSYGALFMCPWGYLATLPEDYDVMDKMMRTAVAGIETVNNRKYKFGPTYTTIYPTSGGTRDHMYGAGGVVNSYGIECFGSSFTPPTSHIIPIGREIWEGLKELALRM